MIRLYPRYVQSEESIQDMRQLLSKIQSENWNQADQLSDATMRIRELGAELGRAEMEQRMKYQDFEESAMQASERRDEMSSELEEHTQLSVALRQTEADYNAKLRGLALSEMESKKRWDVILAQQDQLSELSEQLGRHAADHMQLSGCLERAGEERSALFAEYREAEQLASTRREEIREMAAACSSDSANATGLEAESKELKREVARLSEWFGRSQAEIAVLAPETSAHEGLRDNQRRALRERQSLEQLVSFLMRRFMQRTAERELVTHHVATLRESIDNEQRELSDCRKDKEVLTTEIASLTKQVEEASVLAEETKLRLSEVKTTGERLETELRADLSKNRDQVAKCQRDIAEVEKEMRRLKSSIQADRVDTQNASTSHDELSRDHQRLVARQKEAQKQLSKEKKRLRLSCTVM